MISYWPSYRSDRGKPRANTAYLGPVSGPIRNHWISNIIVRVAKVVRVIHMKIGILKIGSIYHLVVLVVFLLHWLVSGLS